MSRLAIVASVFGLLACSGRDDQAVKVRDPAADLAKLEPAPTKVAPVSIYGPDGALLASTEKIGVVVLPMGLTPDASAPDQFEFDSQVPIEKLVAFFGDELETAVVERVGNGAIYRNAKVRGHAGPERYDVTVLPGRRAQHVVIRPRKEPPPLPSEAEILKKLNEELRQQRE